MAIILTTIEKIIAKTLGGITEVKLVKTRGLQEILTIPKSILA
jgi:hypothetical protein